MTHHVHPYASFCCLLLVLLALPPLVGAQQPADKFLREVVYVDSDSVMYGLFVPEDLTTQDLYPVIISLGGSGDIGNADYLYSSNTATWATDSSQQANPSFIVAPEYPSSSFDEYTYFPYVLAPALDSILGSLSLDYPVDMSRIYLTGLSLGAMAGWPYVYSTWPDRFAAVLFMSGHWVFPSPPPVNGTPVWAFCGARDYGLIHDVRSLVEMISDAGFDVHRVSTTGDNVGVTIAQVDSLMNSGVHHIYTEHVDLGHGPWRHIYDDPVVHHWLFAHRRVGTASESWTELPSRLDLRSFPNPFSNEVTLTFALPESSEVQIEVFDLQGRKVAVPVKATLPMGVHSVPFAANSLPSGLYLARMQSRGQSVTKTLILLR